MERAIHISSINREKTGENRPDNFLIKFNPPLKLDPIKKHSLAIDRLTMTYSWYNIRSSYNHDGTHRISTVSTPYKSLYKLYSIPNIPRFNPYRDSSL